MMGSLEDDGGVVWNQSIALDQRLPSLCLL
jgi:hypothetical protein